MRQFATFQIRVISYTIRVFCETQSLFFGTRKLLVTRTCPRMLKSLHTLKLEQLIGLLLVLALHGAGLYGLWRYNIIPTPDEAVTLMVNLINPPKPPEPELPKPPEPEPLKPPPVEPPPEPVRLAVETPAVMPAEPVVYAPPPEPVVEAPPAPLQPQAELPGAPMELANELSVICKERSAPHYPLVSKRLNEQGKVVLRVELGEDGKVFKATVRNSSGFERLDAAALTAVKTWRCKPPVRGDAAVRATALQPFNFSLTESE